MTTDRHDTSATAAGAQQARRDLNVYPIESPTHELQAGERLSLHPLPVLDEPGINSGVADLEQSRRKMLGDEVGVYRKEPNVELFVP
jgi:hypothetical protein